MQIGVCVFEMPSVMHTVHIYIRAPDYEKVDIPVQFGAGACVVSMKFGPRRDYRVSADKSAPI